MACPTREGRKCNITCSMEQQSTLTTPSIRWCQPSFCAHTSTSVLWRELAHQCPNKLLKGISDFGASIHTDARTNYRKGDQTARREASNNAIAAGKVMPYLIVSPAEEPGFTPRPCLSNGAGGNFKCIRSCTWPPRGFSAAFKRFPLDTCETLILSPNLRQNYP